MRLGVGYPVIIYALRPTGAALRLFVVGSSVAGAAELYRYAPSFKLFGL
jgi:hypothetical protein